MRVVTKIVHCINDERGVDEFVEFTVEAHATWNHDAQTMTLMGIKAIAVDGGWRPEQFHLEDLRPHQKTRTEEALADQYWSELQSRDLIEALEGSLKAVA
jgi:hypothetical protein